MIRIRIRSSKPSSLTHAFLAKDVSCTCGSTDVQPEPGAFGEVGNSLGFSRFWCRACHKHFWLRTAVLWSSTIAADEHAEADVVELTPPRRMQAESPKRPSLASLDRLQAVAPTDSAPADLSALDNYLAELSSTNPRGPEGGDQS